MTTNDLPDTFVLDAIATLMGTSDDWNGGDICEAVADLIGATNRPHPGVGEGVEYAGRFFASTGRPLIAAYINDDAIPVDDEA